MNGAREMESLGQLAATLAHEFNNILMPVIAYPELMLRDLPEDSPLLKLGNITLTSHLAGVTQDTYRLSMELLYRNLADFLQKGRQDNLVNPSVAERPDLKSWLEEMRQ